MADVESNKDGGGESPIRVATQVALVLGNLMTLGTLIWILILARPLRNIGTKSHAKDLRPPSRTWQGHAPAGGVGPARPAVRRRDPGQGGQPGPGDDFEAQAFWMWVALTVIAGLVAERIGPDVDLGPRRRGVEAYLLKVADPEVADLIAIAAAHERTQEHRCS